MKMIREKSSQEMNNAAQIDASLLKKVFHELRLAQRVLIISHIRPDGDAVGSLIGLGLSLHNLGKDVQMVISDGCPEIFRHLPGSDQVKKKAEGEFDMTLVVDCSDRSRAGDALNGVSLPEVNIDHHPTNTDFARYNLIDVSAVATAEMLGQYLPEFGFPIPKQVADALLFGMITDTLGFRTNNMTPRAMKTAAMLMEAGGDLPGLYKKGLLNRSYAAARYWGAGLTNLERDGRIIWASLSLQDRSAVSYPGRDDADLINFLSTIDAIDVVMMFIEQEKGQVKVSWRAAPTYDVSQVAMQFGGGGHKAAAGASIEGGLKEVQSKVINTTKLILEIK
jgi:phosphoesterase RecJ-like protein